MPLYQWHSQHGAGCQHQARLRAFLLLHMHSCSWFGGKWQVRELSSELLLRTVLWRDWKWECLFPDLLSATSPTFFPGGQILGKCQPSFPTGLCFHEGSWRGQQLESCLCLSHSPWKQPGLQLGKASLPVFSWSRLWAWFLSEISGILQDRRLWLLPFVEGKPWPWLLLLPPCLFTSLRSKCSPGTERGGVLFLPPPCPSSAQRCLK